jgi:superoxide dismutase, Fe-Mn family
MAFELPPLP